MNHRVLVVSSSLSACCIFVGCKGDTVFVGELDQRRSPVSTADDGGVAVLDGSIDSTQQLRPECNLSAEPLRSFISSADMEAHVTGTWWRCSGFINAPTDAEGLDLSVTRARFLVKDGDSLAYKADVLYESKVTVDGIDSLGFQSRLGSNNYVTRASDDGRFMEMLEITGWTTTRWARASSAPKPAAPPSSCAVATALELTSVADVTTRLTGRWSVCSGDLQGEGSTSAAGIEFVPSNAYYLVDTAGTLVRASSAQPFLVWPNDNPVFTSFQVDVAGRPHSATIDESGNQLVLNSFMMAKTAVLKRVP